ncbi:MAG: OmpH family outer membrane protein [Bacteroidales bacterium]|nr:OmpH family outer membrane protein [Bacteroidales bacterium]
MNKTIFSVAKAFAFAVVCSAIMSCSNGNNGASNTSASVSSSDIAYVNMDSLIDKYDLYNDLSTQLMTKQNELEQDFQSKAKSLERKALDLQNQYNKNLITPTRAQEVQQNLQVEQQKLMNWRDEKLMELSDDQSKISKMVYDSIKNYVDIYNAEKGYKFILSNNLGGVLLYGDKKADITEDILKALNKRYQGSTTTLNVDSLAN